MPCSAIKGARAPFLEIKPEVWEVLSENGFLYDRCALLQRCAALRCAGRRCLRQRSACAPGTASPGRSLPRALPLPPRSSLIEEGMGESLTQGMGRRLWPYDMGKGIPQNCDYFADTQ